MNAEKDAKEGPDAANIAIPGSSATALGAADLKKVRNKQGENTGCKGIVLWFRTTLC